MMACKMRALVFVLFLISMKITENDADAKGTKRKCSRELKKCSLKNECFSNLPGNSRYLKEECPAMASPRLKKSLHIAEKLYFAPHILTIGYFPTNWTYSVFLSDDYYGANLEPVTNCCNLRRGDTCDMPATHNKTRRFFAIFPYKDGEYSLYCYYRIPYSDAPIDVCEKGKEIIDKCIYFDNGDFKIKYRYTPLSDDYKESAPLEHDGCYLTLWSKMLPRGHQNIQYDKPYVIADGMINDTINGNKSEIAEYIKRHGCKHYDNVTSSNYRTILLKTFKPDRGDIVCFKVESFLAGFPFRPVLCQRVKKTGASPLQVWQVAVPIAAFVGLILFISLVRVCRAFHETTIEKNKRPGFIREEDSTTKTPDTPTPSEVFYEVRAYDEIEDTEAPDLTVGLHEGMSSRSTDTSIIDDKSEEKDEKESLAESSTGSDSIGEKNDSIPTSPDNATSSENHNPYDSKEPLLGDVAGVISIDDGYLTKYFKKNIELCSPSTTTYMPKYIKKNVTPRSPMATGAFA